MPLLPSYDPRINRIELPSQDIPYEEENLLQWQNYEVFTQQHRGEQHVHTGSVHAPNAEMALLLAKEQFGRREQCANIWVVKSRDIHATSYEDSDMFLHSFDKNYREGNGYKVKDTIESFKRDLFARLEKENRISPQTPTPTPEKTRVEKGQQVTVIHLPTLEGKPTRKVIIRN
ncbi:MAG: 1,2-phenylacetyl-CoA epoxidase subunit PaaB [Bacteroidia bacterium]|nr:1,2-phenylacetyl-CoA epoxidase subunit PaaB [Bacteroidia bacterium]